MCKAVIMAGGEGKRLRPITCTLPKPMVPLLNKPVIDYCIELLKKHGVDAMTDADLTEAMCFHKARGAAVTIVLKRVSVPTEYGVAMTDSKGKIYRFLEKPMLSEVFSDLANTGIYILEPEVIERIPEGETSARICFRRS